jgi:signal transduction histidine kinase/CheY-like chemotaxis protein
MQNRRRDGTLFWESAVISPVKDASGRVAHFVAVKEDITSRKVLEAELLQAQKMEAVGRLAGGVAHDFNNLLTVISGFTELTLGRLGAGHACEGYLKEVQRASVQAASLTRQLLAFSRRQVLQPAVVDLGGVVANMQKMLRRILGEDVALEVRRARDLAMVLADPGQVEQALMNLCVNARDAMPSGGRLEVVTENADLDGEAARSRPGASPGRYVSLTVRDTGHGMAPEVLAHVFEPFFTTKPQGKGTGLGLAMVYGFVKQSGGYVEVDSAPGRGTAVRVLLPRVEVPSDGAREPPAPAAALRGTETILVVEDQGEVARVMRTSLEEQGYRVLLAGGAEAAARAVGEHGGPVHLLVTDVVMPGRNGREVADLVSERRPGIRVLFMSGYTDDAIVRHGVLEPGVEFLPKPFTPAALCRRVREVLDSPRGQTPPPP